MQRCWASTDSAWMLTSQQPTDSNANNPAESSWHSLTIKSFLYAKNCPHVSTWVRYFVPVFCVCDSYHSYPKTHSSPWILSLDIDIMLSPVKCLFRSALLCLRDTFLNPKTYSLSMVFIAKVRLYAFSY